MRGKETRFVYAQAWKRRGRTRRAAPGMRANSLSLDIADAIADASALLLVQQGRCEVAVASHAAAAMRFRDRKLRAKSTSISAGGCVLIGPSCLLRVKARLFDLNHCTWSGIYTSHWLYITRTTSCCACCALVHSFLAAIRPTIKRRARAPPLAGQMHTAYVAVVYSCSCACDFEENVQVG